MIPTFVMPPVLQTLAQISPMAWSLNGFLDALVRGANVGDLAGSCALLLGSAAILWLADRKSTRLNSSHVAISYAVFCLKKKKKQVRRDNVRQEGIAGQ